MLMQRSKIDPAVRRCRHGKHIALLAHSTEMLHRWLRQHLAVGQLRLLNVHGLSSPLDFPLLACFVGCLGSYRASELRECVTPINHTPRWTQACDFAIAIFVALPSPTDLLGCPKLWNASDMPRQVNVCKSFWHLLCDARDALELLESD